MNYQAEEVRAMAERLRAKYYLDLDDGHFYRREAVDWRFPAGSRVGYQSKARGREYWVIKFEGRNMDAHRLVWLYVHGEFPVGQLDHVNCIKHDNRLCNLRECTQEQNNRNKAKQDNNTTGVKNVVRIKSTGKYRVQMRDRGRYLHVGVFESLDDAARVATEARHKLHGEFANDN